MPDPTLAAARTALVGAYEDLRRTALSGSGRGIGFALLVRSGVAAWIAMCASLARPLEAPAARRSTGQPLVPQNFQVEVATLLAEMALSAHFHGATT
jgi:hypothetical protein